MTDQELQAIEKHIGYSLPEYYRATSSNYPFPLDSFADEFMLLNAPEVIIELNSAEISPPGIGKPFFIGSDGGEESYFVDTSKDDSGVFVFGLETGNCHLLVPSWTAFLDHIRAEHAEIAADEEVMRQCKLNKKWWEFWK